MGGFPDFPLQNVDNPLKNVLHDRGAHQQSHVARPHSPQDVLGRGGLAAQSRHPEEAAVGVDPSPVFVHVAPGARVELFPRVVQEDLSLEHPAASGALLVQQPPAAPQHLHHARLHPVAELEREVVLAEREKGRDL